MTRLASGSTLWSFVERSIRTGGGDSFLEALPAAARAAAGGGSLVCFGVNCGESFFGGIVHSVGGGSSTSTAADGIPSAAALSEGVLLRLRLRRMGFRRRQR